MSFSFRPTAANYASYRLMLVVRELDRKFPEMSVKMTHGSSLFFMKTESVYDIGDN